MAGTKEATTMSVREMREHLGIKKTESYFSTAQLVFCRLS